MPDREKVIEALEACVLKDPDDSRDCRHCPRCNYGAFITTSCINGVMADALALLKAQEPREMSDAELMDAIRKAPIMITPAVDAAPVVHSRWKQTDAYPHWLYCLNCYKRIVPNVEWIEEYSIPTNYCPNCGAKMDKED